MQQTQAGFDHIADYVLDRRCTSCKADAGLDCTSTRVNSAFASQLKKAQIIGSGVPVPPREDRQHRSRQNKGFEHYLTDLVNAPPADERPKGKNFSTLRLGPF